MPIYEYHCHDCQERISVFFRSFAEAEKNEAACPDCGGLNLKRLISNVAVLHGKQNTHQRQAASPDSAKEDPMALARTMREASRTAGQDFGSDFNEVASRLEKGESATSIEKSLRKRVGESMDGPTT